MPHYIVIITNIVDIIIIIDIADITLFIIDYYWCWLFTPAITYFHYFHYWLLAIFSLPFHYTCLRHAAADVFWHTTPFRHFSFAADIIIIIDCRHAYDIYWCLHYATLLRHWCHCYASYWFSLRHIITYYYAAIFHYALLPLFSLSPLFSPLHRHIISVDIATLFHCFTPYYWLRFSFTYYWHHFHYYAMPCWFSLSPYFIEHIIIFTPRFSLFSLLDYYIFFISRHYHVTPTLPPHYFSLSIIFTLHYFLSFINTLFIFFIASPLLSHFITFQAFSILIIIAVITFHCLLNIVDWAIFSISPLRHYCHYFELIDIVYCHYCLKSLFIVTSLITLLHYYCYASFRHLLICWLRHYVISSRAPLLFSFFFWCLCRYMLCCFVYYYFWWLLYWHADTLLLFFALLLFATILITMLSDTPPLSPIIIFEMPPLLFALIFVSPYADAMAIFAAYFSDYFHADWWLLITAFHLIDIFLLSWCHAIISRWWLLRCHFIITPCQRCLRWLFSLPLMLPLRYYFAADVISLIIFADADTLFIWCLRCLLILPCRFIAITPRMMAPWCFFCRHADMMTYAMLMITLHFRAGRYCFDIHVIMSLRAIRCRRHYAVYWCFHYYAMLTLSLIDVITPIIAAPPFSLAFIITFHCCWLCHCRYYEDADADTLRCHCWHCHFWAPLFFLMLYDDAIITLYGITPITPFIYYFAMFILFFHTIYADVFRHLYDIISDYLRYDDATPLLFTLLRRCATFITRYTIIIIIDIIVLLFIIFIDARWCRYFLIYAIAAFIIIFISSQLYFHYYVLLLMLPLIFIADIAMLLPRCYALLMPITLSHIIDAAAVIDAIRCHYDIHCFDAAYLRDYYYFSRRMPAVTPFIMLYYTLLLFSLFHLLSRHDDIDASSLLRHYCWLTLPILSFFDALLLFLIYRCFSLLFSYWLFFHYFLSITLIYYHLLLLRLFHY